MIAEMSRRVPTGTALPALMVALAMASSPGRAHPPRASRARVVLHEPLPEYRRPLRHDRLVRSAGGGLAEAIETASGRIDRPEPHPRAAPRAPLYEARTRPRRVAADRMTRAEGTLHYTAVFDPTVAPFKRDLALDRVNEAGELEQSGVGRRPLRLPGDKLRGGHELFWGHVTLELVPGKQTPLPSVAPSSAIVQASPYPPWPLSFFVDAAGNFSVTSRRAGTVELRYVMDAPSEYFGAPIGRGPVRDDPAQPVLPEAIQARMETLWPALGVSPARSRRDNVRRLAEYFRSFESGVLPAASPGADLLTTLIVARRGVCRHRSHAFVVMAQSLGIPAHYVINDAHAFAELWVPAADGRGRWQRVDLGGGADALRLHGAVHKHLHEPLYRDPLPRPRSYATGITRLQADGRLNDSSWAGAARVLGAPAPAGSGTGDGTGSGGHTGGGGSATGPLRDEAAKRREAARRRAAIARNVAAPEGPPGRHPTATGGARVGTRIELAEVAPVVYVGESTTLRGHLLADSGTVPAGLAIGVWLVPPRKPGAGRRVGSAITESGGAFEARFAVPLRSRPGEYDLVLYFAGRGKLAPSWSK